MLTSLNQYIPLQNGQANMIKSQNLINNLLGVVGYEVRDGYIIFTEDITNPAGQNVNAVDIQIVTMDLDHYGDYDLLPLTSDMAAQIITEVVGMLAPTPAPDLRVDSRAEEPINKR